MMMMMRVVKFEFLLRLLLVIYYPKKGNNMWFFRQRTKEIDSGKSRAFFRPLLRQQHVVQLEEMKTNVS